MWAYCKMPQTNKASPTRRTATDEVVTRVPHMFMLADLVVPEADTNHLRLFGGLKLHTTLFRRLLTVRTEWSRK